MWHVSNMTCYSRIHENKFIYLSMLVFEMNSGYTQWPTSQSLFIFILRQILSYYTWARTYIPLALSSSRGGVTVCTTMPERLISYIKTQSSNNPGWLFLVIWKNLNSSHLHNPLFYMFVNLKRNCFKKRDYCLKQLTSKWQKINETLARL